MADLTIQCFWQCASAEGWATVVRGSKGDEYTVSFTTLHKHQEDVVYDYACTCKAYKYRPGYCKHIETSKKEHCNWRQFLDGGDVIEKDGEHYCPECKANAVSREHGV